MRDYCNGECKQKDTCKVEKPFTGWYRDCVYNACKQEGYIQAMIDMATLFSTEMSFMTMTEQSLEVFSDFEYEMFCMAIIIGDYK